MRNIFEVSGGSRGDSKILISDPANPEKVLICKSKPGKWTCEAFVEEKVDGLQITKIVAEYSEDESKKAGVFVDYNTDYHKAMNMLMGSPKIEIAEQAFNVEVSSCVIGIFDLNNYNNPNSVSSCDRLYDSIICEENPFYSFCCDRALCEDRWGVIPYGCVSSSQEGKVVVRTFRKKASVDSGIFKVEIDFVAQPVAEPVEEDEDSVSPADAHSDEMDDVEAEEGLTLPEDD